MMIAPGGDFARRLLIRLKQPFATFIESVAVAAMLQSNEQTLHGLDPINQRPHLPQFSLGQFSPTGRCPGATGKTKNSSRISRKVNRFAAHVVSQQAGG